MGVRIGAKNAVCAQRLGKVGALCVARAKCGLGVCGLFDLGFEVQARSVGWVATVAALPCQK